MPPARYTDASLVKRLEEDGIGRPSTYASIISTIERRGYVWRQGKALVPTFTAFAVTHLLKEHFGPLVELGFTGLIEENLDEIAKGERERDDFLATFYNGDGGRSGPGCGRWSRTRRHIDYPVIALGEHPDTGSPVVVRIGQVRPVRPGRRGRRRAQRVDARRMSPPAEFTLEQAIELVEARARGPASLGERPVDGAAGLRHDGPIRPVRPARRDAGEGQQGEAAPGIADRGRRRGHDHARSERSSCCRCRGSSASTPRRARRSSPTSAGSVRTSSAATSSDRSQRRRRCSRSRSTRRSSCSSRRSASRRTATRRRCCASSARIPTRGRPCGSRGPVRAVRQRRDDERVAARRT